MRFSTLFLALALLPALAFPVASANLTQVCTGGLIESVQACASTNGCATVWLGPAGHTVCAGSLVGAVHVCTTNLVESVGVCVDTAPVCVTLYAGPAATPVCLGKLLA
ncbi:MAG: hypothetical protein QOE90_3124 [Thermoplasmata archaeon]|jgi:hypothetical protein|nr:hypothetical protein [Thermoplasmata archaeon]